jgi:hypothetical protein
MAPLEEAGRRFGGGGDDEKKGQRKRLCNEKRRVLGCKEGDARHTGYQASAINLPLTIRDPPPPRKPQKPSHVISLLPSSALNYL